MLNIFLTYEKWCEYRNQYKKKRIGFVPTMGNLHQGHLSLIDTAQQENDITVVSIFINPTQFNNKNDLESYPTTLAKDIDLLKRKQVDALFLPSYDEMYPDQYHYQIEETLCSKLLEGAFRPGHFNGVLTIVLKLLNIISPHALYLGEKDYQQYLLVKNMVDAFYLEVDVVACPTIREKNGLAMSSRNSLLCDNDREKSSLLFKLLTSSLSIDVIKEKLKQNGFKVDYIEEKYNRRFAAVSIGGVRLIDNIDMSSVKNII